MRAPAAEVLENRVPVCGRPRKAPETEGAQRRFPGHGNPVLPTMWQTVAKGRHGRCHRSTKSETRATTKSCTQSLHLQSVPKKLLPTCFDTLGSSCHVGCVEAVQTSRPELTTLASCLPVSTVGSPCLSNNRVLKSTPRSLFLPWLLGAFSSKPSESQKTVKFRFMQFIDRIVCIQVVLQRWVPTHCSWRKVEALSAASSEAGFHFWDACQNVEDRQNAIEPVSNMWDGKDDRFPKTDLDGCCIKGCRVPLG